MNTQTQKQAIAAHLRSGKSITPMDALHKYGCFRLGARIFDLKNDDGMDINTEIKSAGRKRWAVYSLNKTT